MEAAAVETTAAEMRPATVKAAATAAMARRSFGRGSRRGERTEPDRSRNCESYRRRVAVHF
jgi:hypothetical protein